MSHWGHDRIPKYPAQDTPRCVSLLGTGLSLCPRALAELTTTDLSLALSATVLYLLIRSAKPDQVNYNK